MNNIIQIQNLIYTIRNQKIMLDSDLAKLYEVPTSRLNEAVKRNIKRFPINFMFQLTKEEYQVLMSQNAISKNTKGGRRFMPYAFTEQGVAMLSSVLNSEQAIQINIQIINTFVKMRQWAIENKELSARLTQLENYFIEHSNENQDDLKKIYDTLNLLLERTKPSQIGFVKNEK